MRLWSIHPRHLDARGLVALWREGLLARAVLGGKTRGYRHHPQLDRFRAQDDPLGAIDGYLSAVCDEADRRGYRFDREKLVQSASRGSRRIAVTDGQLRHEASHLRRKLFHRDRRAYLRARNLAFAPHPLFRVVRGPIAPWERVEAQARDARGPSSRPTARSRRTRLGNDP